MTLPEPLVPAECSMVGNEWFPLHFGRLRKSKWWRRATDLARARNVMMWGEAYAAVPAGSLPDDDDDLAEAAGFGMDVAAFLVVKAEIMAPWSLCSDGRWYHPTVCEVVIEAWEKQSEKRKAAAAKKAAQRAKVRGQASPGERVPAENADVPKDTANVPGDTTEKGGDIDTHKRRGQERTEDTPQPPNGGEPKTGQDQQQFDLATEALEPPDEVQLAFDAWNATASACGLPRAKTLDENRRRAIRKRLEAGGIDLWREALTAIEVSAFLRGLRPGGDGRIFKADLTFVCQAKSFQRLVDGGYGEDAPPPRPAGPAAVADDPDRRRVREFVANKHWNRLDWGAPPGQPGCRVSPEIQREFGIDPARLQAVGGGG